MPETSLHAYFSNLIVSAIRWMFRDRHDVFVTSNFVWYPEPNDSKDTDVLVVIGRTDEPRSSWRDAREDGMSPQVVFEIKSKSNTLAHVTAKRRWYDRHGWRSTTTMTPSAAHSQRGVAPRIQATSSRSVGVRGTRVLAWGSRLF